MDLPRGLRRDSARVLRELIWNSVSKDVLKTNGNSWIQFLRVQQRLANQKMRMWPMQPQGQKKGNCDSDRFHIRTLGYSLRRVSPLDSVNCRPHNPKAGGSNPPPQPTSTAPPAVPTILAQVERLQANPTCPLRCRSNPYLTRLGKVCPSSAKNCDSSRPCWLLSLWNLRRSTTAGSVLAAIVLIGSQVWRVPANPSLGPWTLA